jgi:two-component system, cell cycle sensor histidine kinase and response regulator CckA
MKANGASSMQPARGETEVSSPGPPVIGGKQPSPPMHILILEDDPHDRQLLEKALVDEGLVCQTTHAKSKEEFRAALERGKFDLIISDFALPAYSGIAALTASRGLQPETPFIFVSGTTGEEQAVESLKSGATDYVLKDQLNNRLGPVVRRALREAQERKERQLAEALAQVQSRALDAAAHSILLTDAAGKIVFANKAFCAMTGYALEEILGQTPRLLKSGKHDAEFFRELWETILASRVWQGEITNRRKDGSLYTDEMTITPIPGNDGEISHFIAVKQDITRRKQLKGQWHQAEKMEVIGRFAGGIARDFSNLLTIIYGNAEMVLMDETQLKEQNRQYLKQVTDATDRAANLTRQLLAIGRKQVVQFQPLNLNQVINNFTKMLNRVIGGQIALQCCYAKDLPLVDADAGMIEQILINLIVNARDAMPQGGSIVITTEAVNIGAAYLETHPEAQPGEFVCITVADTGTGIYPEYLPRIFEPFFTTKEAGKGTGLGLATVYGIVKQHQGWVEVSSQLGGGTTFKIFLPAGVSEAAISSMPQIKAKPSGGHEKILLVEDDADVRMVARDVLEGSGYQVWEASDGLEALNIWKTRASQIDLLLTDIIMPGGLNGRELADRLRRERPGLKVILMSGYSPERLGKIQTHSRLLQKPFSLENLTETVRTCLDAARPTD